MKKLKIGDTAPEINSVDQNGNIIDLKNYRGSKIVIYFYPKDNTPGCTAEACNLRDNYQHLQSKGYKVIGISSDNETSHKNFADKYQLPFPLIADTEKKIIMDYGVWGQKKFMGKTYDGILRTTFIIDEEGKIEEIIEKVDTKNHSNQILKHNK